MQVHTRMAPRDPTESHRAATPLELLFDLTFVVAIAQAAAALHHGLVDGHASEAMVAFPLVFFGIWWAWMNLTWFASAYDTDDVAYRIAMFVQIAGVLILAAGVPRAMDGGHFEVMTVGYLVMRLGLVGLWLRAAASHPEGRTCALRYAGGIAAVQVLWLLRLLLPIDVGVATFVVLAAAEMAVPWWAERGSRTPWHPGHIAERYGLFTIIVLGETVLSATVGVQAALDADSTVGDLATLSIGGLLLVLSMWWIYFDLPNEQVVVALRASFDEQGSAAFVWGYGHYFVFLGAAATGAGLAVGIDQVTGHSDLTDVQAGLALTVPVAIYLLSIWLLHLPYKPAGVLRTYGVPVTIVVVLAASFTPEPVLVAGLAVVSLVAVWVVANQGRLVDDVGPRAGRRPGVRGELEG